ncbi:hypothetical protein GDO81_019019 [Engystomops pustulosus]|uniref:Uncharacterized protein n=1 Tax=Engystomops pustulosus TaxID=76066 RepID=A0AAV6ZGA8_ENGPU|nr:hypothetical protein GDO81_019019 [Engystomops pustulosus]
MAYKKWCMRLHPRGNAGCGRNWPTLSRGGKHKPGLYTWIEETWMHVRYYH